MGSVDLSPQANSMCLRNIDPIGLGPRDHPRCQSKYLDLTGSWQFLAKYKKELCSAHVGRDDGCKGPSSRDFSAASPRLHRLRHEHIIYIGDRRGIRRIQTHCPNECVALQACLADIDDGNF